LRLSAERARTMRWTMAERRVLVKAYAARYQRGGKKARGEVLDEFVEASGYNRSYGSWLLRWHGKRVALGMRRVVVGDATTRARRRRARIYGGGVVEVLERLWRLMDYPSGKRMRAALPVWIPVLERYRELDVSEVIRDHLLSISAATIDRVLAPVRRRVTLRSRARTKPGTLLKHQVPVRTFAEWNEVEPGFCELDLVGHDGGVARGEYLQTLDVTDVATGWTELAGVRNRAQIYVHAAIREIRRRLPFELLGIDADNGGEFINHNLISYCTQEGITFTRSRPYRKNDNCFVEEKNWSVVRRFAGYARYDTERQLEVLNELYRTVRLYVNFFLPSMKLVEKIRDGSRVRKRYDPPQTPYQRVVASTAVGEDRKVALQATLVTLNPAALHRAIRRLQARLARLAHATSTSPEHVGAMDGAGLRKAGTRTPAPTFPQPLEISRSEISTPTTAPPRRATVPFHADSQ